MPNTKKYVKPAPIAYRKDDKFGTFLFGLTPEESKIFWQLLRARSKDAEIILYEGIRKYCFALDQRRSLKLNDPGRVDELATEVWMAMVKAASKNVLRDPSRLKEYIVNVHYHTWCKLIHSLYKHEYRSRRDEVIKDHDNPERSVLLKDRRKEVESLFGCLNELQRNIVNRFYFLEESQEEIMKDMRLKHGTFRNEKSRALKLMAETAQKRKSRSNRVSLASLVGIPSA